MRTFAAGSRISKIALAVTAGLLVGANSAHAAPSPVPPVTTNLQMWYEADSVSGGNGQAVTTWTDKSGRGRTLSSATSAAAATLRRNAINGRSALEFNGTRSLMKTYSSTFTLTQPDTFFVVYKSLDADTAGVRNFVFDSRNSSQRQVLGRPGPGLIRMYANSDMDFPGFTYPNANYGIWSGTFSGNASSLFLNGSLVGSSNAGGSSLTGFTVGGLNNAGNDGYDMGHSLVAEILYYNGTMSPSSQQSVVNWLNEKYATFGVPVKPANTAAPAITGTATSGSTLTASNGTWTGTQPISYAYQWLRCDTSGASCVSIANATASTYTATNTDIGSTLRVTVTASNTGGGTAANSAATGTVAAPPPAPPSNTSAPSVTGTAVVGGTLTTTNGQWSGSQPITFTYAWRRCDANGNGCTPIGGAASASYQPASADIGSTLRSVVTGTNTGGQATGTSAASELVVSNQPPPSDSPPVTSGLQLWYEADTSAYGDGQTVNRWPDQSGHARDLTAGSAAAEPTLRRNAINGRAALEFDGTDSLLKTYESNFTIAQPDTYFIVYKDLNSREAYVWDSRNSAVRQLLGQGPFSDMEMYANVDLIDYNVTWPFPDFELWSGTFQGSTSTLYRNGGLVGTGQTGASDMDGFTVGGMNTGTDTGYHMSHSLVAEVLFYSGALTGSQRDSVTSWLNQRYGVIPAATPPANTAAPTISGSTSDGHKLTAANGTWSGTQPQSYAYQWRRCDAGGASCASISGATSSTYLLTSDDVNSTIKVVVTASNSAGQASATSDATPVIAAASNTGPPVSAGLEMWYDASAEPLADGDPVTTWTDRSGNGRNLTAAASAAAGTYRANAIGGHPAVEFNGTSSLLKTYDSTFTISQPDTFFVVYQSLDPDTAGVRNFVFDSRDSASARQAFGRPSQGAIRIYANSDMDVPGITYPFPGFQVWSGTFDSGTGSLYRDTTQVGSGYAGFSNLSGFTLGGLNSGGNNGYDLTHAKVAEVLLYSGAMSAADRTTMTAYLDQKYGLGG